MDMIITYYIVLVMMALFIQAMSQTSKASTGADYEVVETDRIRYITPNVSDLHIVFWLGGGEFGLADYSIKEYNFGGPASLNTTATEVVPAINEVLAAVADTSGVTAAFQVH